MSEGSGEDTGGAAAPFEDDSEVTSDRTGDGLTTTQPEPGEDTGTGESVDTGPLDTEPSSGIIYDTNYGIDCESTGLDCVHEGDLSEAELGRYCVVERCRTVIGDLEVLPDLKLDCIHELEGSVRLEMHELEGIYRGLRCLESASGDVTLGHGDYALTGFNRMTHIGGNLHVEGAKIEVALGLRGLETIGGSLLVNSSFGRSAMDLSQLTGLRSVGGNLLVDQAATAEVLSGPPNLQQIGGELVLRDLEIESLDGFESLTRIDGDLGLVDNRRLKDISGLSALESVGGDLTFTGNSALSIEAIEALLASIGEDNIGGTVTVD